MTTSTITGQVEAVMGRLFDNTKVVLETVTFSQLQGDTALAPITVHQIKQIRGIAVLGFGSNAASGIYNGNLNLSQLVGYSTTSQSGNTTSSSSIAGGNVITLSYAGVPQISSAAYIQMLVFGQ